MYNVTFDILALLDLFVNTFMAVYVVSEIKGIVNVTVKVTVSKVATWLV